MRGKAISALIVLLIIAWAAWTFYFEVLITKPTGDSYRNITDVSSAYNADAEIATAMDRMKTKPESAGVISAAPPIAINSRYIALTFDGLADRVVVQKVLDLLEKYKIKATFFVDGMQTAEDPQAVVNIRQAGHKIENYTLLGQPKMETLPVDRLVKDFCRSQKIVKVTTDQGPNLLKCNETNYTERVLQTAKACGFTSVVKNEIVVSAKTKSDQAINELIKKIRPGSIVSVKLSPGPDLIVNEHGKIDLKPAVDKQPGLKVLPQPLETGEKEIVIAVEKLLAALNREKISTTYLEITPPSIPMPKTTAGIFPSTFDMTSEYHNYALNIQKAMAVVWDHFAGLFVISKAYAAESAEKTAQEMKMVFTTEQAVSYTFSGLSNQTAVFDVVSRLKRMGVKGTFFVAEAEMRQHPNTVRRIIESGHEIGLAIRPKEGEAVDSIRRQIISGRKMLQSQYGIKTTLVKQPTGAVMESTQQAVASLGCTLVGHSITAVQSKHKEYTSASQVIDELFPASVYALSRGQIVHFRMDFYTNPQLVGELVEVIKQRKIDNIAFSTYYDNPSVNSANDSRYAIKPVGVLLGNKKYAYQYPVDLNSVPSQLRKEGVGPVPNLMEKLSQCYIGNEDVNDGDRVIGFSRMDTRRLDKSGSINTQDKVIFLTFDDWGTDASINKLLYVLRKHHVPAAFFVITYNVLKNPNLLRAIAAEGHEIGSHSDMHKPMAYRDENTGKQVSSQDNKIAYVQELTTSYHKLRDVTGDVTVNGKNSLTRFFRPPQLAISKMGLEAALESGFSYIVGGSYSTHDYNAKDVAELVTRFRMNIYTDRGEVKKGTIMVMHMSDTSLYTAVALDILLTANAAKADTDPSKFKVGRLSDYLVDGYSQFNRKKNLELIQN